MLSDFSNLFERVEKGQAARVEDLRLALDAGPGQIFKLADAAAYLRRSRRGQELEVLNLLDSASGQPASLPDPVAEEALLLAGPLEAESFLAQLEQAQRQQVASLELVFDSQRPLPPMEALKLLALLGLALPETRLHLGEGRQAAFRSLQPLAVRILDSLLLRQDLEAPGLVFEDLALIVGADRIIAGAQERDLVAEYILYLQSQGVEDALAVAAEVLAPEFAGSGCGGNCACGAGGCGS